MSSYTELSSILCVQESHDNGFSSGWFTTFSPRPAEHPGANALLIDRKSWLWDTLDGAVGTPPGVSGESDFGQIRRSLASSPALAPSTPVSTHGFYLADAYMSCKLNFHPSAPTLPIQSYLSKIPRDVPSSQPSRPTRTTSTSSQLDYPP